jgi:hypothetical protein
MLREASIDAAYCYERAAENQQMAAHAPDPELKGVYLDLESRWLALAVSYEFPDQLNQYTAHLTCTLKPDQQRPIPHRGVCLCDAATKAGTRRTGDAASATLPVSA